MPSKLVLHPNACASGYTLGNAAIDVARVFGDHKRQKGWSLFFLYHDRSLTPEDLRAWKQWCEKHGEATTIVFPRLRDAREYLEALFEVDPPPDSGSITEHLRRLRPHPEGGYLLQTEKESYRVTRQFGGQQHWAAHSEITGARLLGCTLAEICDQAAVLG